MRCEWSEYYTIFHSNAIRNHWRSTVWLMMANTDSHYCLVCVCVLGIPPSHEHKLHNNNNHGAHYMTPAPLYFVCLHNINGLVRFLVSFSRHFLVCVCVFVSHRTVTTFVYNICTYIYAFICVFETFHHTISSNNITTSLILYIYIFT